MKILVIAAIVLFAALGAERQDLRQADLDDELAGKRQLEGDQTAAEALYRDALSILDKHPNDGADVRAKVLGGLGCFARDRDGSTKQRTFWKRRCRSVRSPRRTRQRNRCVEIQPGPDLFYAGEGAGGRIAAEGCGGGPADGASERR